MVRPKCQPEPVASLLRCAVLLHAAGLYKSVILKLVKSAVEKMNIFVWFIDTWIPRRTQFSLYAMQIDGCNFMRIVTDVIVQIVCIQKGGFRYC